MTFSRRTGSAQVLRHRPQGRDRQEQQCPDDENRSQQQQAEGQRVVAQRPQAEGRAFFAPRNAAIAISAMIGRYRQNSITRPVAMSQAESAVGEPGWDCC